MPLEVVTKWRDVSQNEARVSFWLTSTTSAGDASNLATELSRWLEQASDAEITGLELNWGNSRLPLELPTSGNLVYPHACLFFRTAGGDEAILALPAAKDVTFQDGLTVDPDHPAIADIIAAMLEGVVGAVAVPSGADLTSYVVGYKQERF